MLFLCYFTFTPTRFLTNEKMDKKFFILPPKIFTGNQFCTKSKKKIVNRKRKINKHSLTVF